MLKVTDPSVSTAGSLRIKAFRRNIRRAPSARAIVTTAGNPSGAAATAKLTAVRNIRSRGSPRNAPSANTTATITIAAVTSRRPEMIEPFLQRSPFRCDRLDQFRDAP